MNARATIAALAGAALLATACSGGTTSPESSGTPGEQVSASEGAAATPVVRSAFAAVDPDQWENYISIEYPVVAGLRPDINAKINKTLEDAFGVADDLAFPDDTADYEGISWQEDAGYSVGMNTPVLLSIQASHHIYTGGAHGLPSTWDLPFDLSTGELVKVMDLLDTSAPAVLSPLVRAELDRTIDLGHEATDEVLLENEAWDAGIDRRGNLVITFQAYGIGPYAIGLPEVTFTAAELGERGLIPEGGLYARALAAIVDKPDSRFGGEVCEELIPALVGLHDGLDRWADEQVLAVLEEFGGTHADGTPEERLELLRPQADVYEQSPTECRIGLFDGWITLTLESIGSGEGDKAIRGEITKSDFGDSATLRGHDPVAVRAAVDEHVAEGLACAGQGVDPDVSMDDELRIIDFNSMTVVFVPCSSTGYQLQYEVLGWEGEWLTLVAVELWVEGEIHDGTMITGFPYADGPILKNVEAWRDLGDCGMASDWVVEPDLLRLASVRMRDCDDPSPPTSADQWPLVWAPDA